MLRNRYRKGTATLPFRIRNNFRRLSPKYTMPVSSQPQDNYDETVLRKDFDEIMSQGEDFSDNDDNGMEQRRADDDIDMIPVSSEENDDTSEEEDYDDASSSESEEENDNTSSSESEEDDNTLSESEEEEYYDDASSSSSESEENTLPEEKLFVDTALGEDKLPSFDGDFAPYFQDFTTTALFCWIHKHNISTNAYEDLVDIIMNSEFDRNHIVKNI